MHKSAFRTRIGAVLAGAALALGGTAQAQTAGPVVQTASGPVEGVYKDAAAEFLGIPFAAPPVGPLRWRPPVAPTPWTAVRPAKSFAPACAQINLLGVFAGPANSNEDCLYLNVFAPRGAVAGKSRLPVFVWIFGGGYVDGDINHYDGTKLAVQGKAIVVAMNYRLNLFGFLAHPALDKEGHLFGNYGTLDQQFALKWVQANIAKFGGDPNNVTLGGQSAGGSSTGSNMMSPLAKGLFHKAIIQSAGAYLNTAPLEVARARGVGFAKAAGCGEGADEATAACLRALPAEAVLNLAGSQKGNSQYIAPFIIRDGQIIPGGGASSFATGNFAKMPVMNGTVRDEGGFFTGIEMYGAGTPPWKTITHDGVAAMVRAVYGANADKILPNYPAERYATAQLRSNAIQSDAFVCKAYHATHLLKGKVPLYVYEFRDRTAPAYFPAMPGYEPLAFHTAELPYLFPGYHGAGVKHDLNPRQQRLSDQMVRLWANFLHTGNPNGNPASKGSKPWPAFGAKTGSYLAINTSGLSTITDASFAADHQCALWAGILTYN